MKTKLTSFYLICGILGTIAYCIPVFIFFFGPVKFSGLWLLYLGNFIFSTLMIFFIILFNKKMDNEASVLSMILAGIKITAITILISCVAVGLLLIIDQHKHLIQVPANADVDKTGGLRPMLLMSASFINFFMGLFSSFI